MILSKSSLNQTCTNTTLEKEYQARRQKRVLSVLIVPISSCKTLGSLLKSVKPGLWRW